MIPIPPPQFIAYLQSPENRWDLALWQTSPDWQGPAPRMLLGGWLNSDAAPCSRGNVYAVCYSNPKLNALAKEAYGSDNPGKLWQEADQLASQDFPWIPLLEKRRVAITSDRVNNWTWPSLATQADITNIALKP